MIEAKVLTKVYPAKGALITAVRSLSLCIHKGEVFGLVGESGSGKSTLGRMLLGLIRPTSGAVFFNGQNVTGKILPRQMQMIFQDPYSSLNPRMTIEAILSEPSYIHKLPDRTLELLDLVGLSRHSLSRFPHEFSGGQRQRIGIARALSLNPDFIVCDEPISALDVSIQAQIINLLIRLQKELRLTYLFIAHDLPMVRYISHRVGVMFAGEIVEMGETDALYSHPFHPYTHQLLSSHRGAPPLSCEENERKVGCPFANRCPFAQKMCREVKPELKEVETGRFVACHFPLRVIVTQ
jgi:oligopeptide/dipeptide ABC transporter ATP-binding protein